MYTFADLLDEIRENDFYRRLSLNPYAQFQTERGALLGARLSPERLVADNAYEETQIRYKTRPALDNSRYSPTQMQKGGRLVGSFRVDLGHTDTQDQFTPEEYDDIMMFMNRGSNMQAMAQAIEWLDRAMVRPHVIKNEIQRWQAWLLGSVKRKTVNNKMDSIDYLEIEGTKVTVPGGTKANPAGWHDPDYDLLGDIITGIEKLEDLGYQANAMYSAPALARVMRKNNEIIKRNTFVRVDQSGQLTSNNVRLTDRGLNRVLVDDELPELTTYNTGYESLEGYKRYIEVEPGYDYLLITASTNRNWDMAINYQGTTTADVSGFTDQALVLNDVLGYHAIGRNAGKSAPGRSLNTWEEMKKPGGLGGESYQTGLPVIQEPQAYYVIRVERPTEA